MTTLVGCLVNPCLDTEVHRELVKSAQKVCNLDILLMGL